MEFTKNVRFKSKLDEFQALARESEKEHEKTAVAMVEETVPDVPVDDNIAKSVLNDSLERVNEEISERSDEIMVELTENEIREFRGILDVKLPTLEQQREGGITVENRINALKIEENNWRDLAQRADPKKKRLYESIADVAALKADELRLRANIRPENEITQNIVEEEAKNNDLTRFERFKKWVKRNLGGISVVAISVTGIITTIVMGARTVVKKGASATRKFARALGKIAEKAGPVLGALLNLAGGILKLGAKAVGFLSENLWILAVIITYAFTRRHLHGIHSGTKQKSMHRSGHFGVIF